MRIVQCQACRTRFRVDESRIRGRGARMRCRKCGEAIIVMKDSGALSGSPPPDNLFDLRSMLKQPEPGPPGEEPSPFDLREPEMQAPRTPESVAGFPPDEAPRETEPVAVEPPLPGQEPEAPAAWEPPIEEPAGSTELPEEPPTEAPEEESPEERVAAETPDEPVSLRVPEEPPRETEPEAVEPPLPGQEPEAPAAWEPPIEEPAGSTELPEEPPTEAPEEESPEERVAAETPSEVFEYPDLPDTRKDTEHSDEGDRSPDGMLPPREDAPAAEETPFELLLNDAASLDFLQEQSRRAGSEGELDISGVLRWDPVLEPEPTETPSPVPSRQFPADEEPMPDRLEAIQRELQEIGGGSPEGMEAPSTPPAAVSPVPPVRKTPPTVREAGAPREKTRSGRPSLLPLAILFLLIAGGGAYLGFTPRGQEILRRTIPAMESLWLGRESAGARFSMGNLIGYYEPDAKAGTLYVIKGTVTNQGQKTRSGIRVMAELFGSNRMYLGSQVVFAGNVLSGEALRTYSREAIGKEMANRWGDKLSNLDIAQGKSIPFMVVFFDAPEGIEEYRLEAWDGG